MNLIYSVLIILAIFLELSQGYSTTLNSNAAKECFLTEAVAGFTLTGTFEVIQGQYLILYNWSFRTRNLNAV